MALSLSLLSLPLSLRACVRARVCLLGSNLHNRMAKALAADCPPPQRTSIGGGVEVTDDGGSGGGGDGGGGGGGGGGGVLSAMQTVYTRLIYVAFMLQLKLLCSVPYVGTASVHVSPTQSAQP